MTLPFMVFAVAVTGILGNGPTQAMITLGVLFTPIFYRITRAAALGLAGPVRRGGRAVRRLRVVDCCGCTSGARCCRRSRSPRRRRLGAALLAVVVAVLPRDRRAAARAHLGRHARLRPGLPLPAAVGADHPVAADHAHRRRAATRSPTRSATPPVPSTSPRAAPDVARNPTASTGHDRERDEPPTASREQRDADPQPDHEPRLATSASPGSRPRPAGLGRATAASPCTGSRSTIGRGESVGLVGESGSGKTLTCRAVLGVLARAGAVDRGRIDLGDGAGHAS